MCSRFQHASHNAVQREVGNRVAARLVKQEDVLAVGDPGSAEAHSHAQPQRLGIEQPTRQRIWNEEPADSS
jgi:hypothetical protein